MTNSRIYTVGHSNHPIDFFLALLRKYSINSVVDVRTIAASGRNPQYNKDLLIASLKRNNIQYLHFAEEFGARQHDPELLDTTGKVDFEKVRKSIRFRQGVQRLEQGIKQGYIIALMCSEGNPLDCHRFSMISIALEKERFEVVHILKDGTLKTNAELEIQMLREYNKKIPQPHLFEQEIGRVQQLAAAYRLKNQEIGYSPYANEPGEKYE